MPHRDDAWTEAQRRRFMRPDAHRFVRHDAWRFMKPGAPRLLGKEAAGYFWPGANRVQPAQPDSREDVAELRAERDELLRMRSELAAIRAEFKFRKLLRALKAYNPNQPRVPAGNPDGGQWTGDERWAGVRVAGMNDPRVVSDAAASQVQLAAMSWDERRRLLFGQRDLFAGGGGAGSAPSLPPFKEGGPTSGVLRTPA